VKTKIFTALFSIVAAFALWLYVITVISPESEATFYNVPVILQGEGELADRGLMITSNSNPTVTLRIAGNRSDLINLNSGNITAVADVTKVWEPGEPALTYYISYPGNIPDNVLSVQSKSPDRITIKVEERISKPVDVEVDYIGSVPEGYIVDKENVNFDFATVMVRGPKPVVDLIDSARIQVNLDDQRESIVERLSYTLCDAEGNPVDAAWIETDVDAVSIILPILRVREVELRVEVIDGGGATEETSNITLDYPTILVSGHESLIEKLNDPLIIGTVNLAELDRDTNLKFPLVLPEGLNNETGITEVNVSVKFPDLLKKKLKLTNFTPMGIAEGMGVEFITKELEIDIRGPKDLVSKMKVSDVIVTVNFLDVLPGTHKLKAVITFTPTYSSVGVIGTYTVTVTYATTEEIELLQQTDDEEADNQ